MEKKELEYLAIEIKVKLDSVSNDVAIGNNLTIGDLKEFLQRVSDFIDFCKFEFGEDITER